MSTDLARRRLLRGLVERITADPPPDPDEGPDAEPVEDAGFFASFETAYALVDECRPFLKDEARRLGLDADHMTELELVRAIFASAAPPAEMRPDDGTAPGDR